MALVSKKDFGDALNISYGTIRSKLSRKQLCCNRKGLVDTEHPLNFIYLVEVNGGDQSVFDNYDINSTNVGKKISPARKKTENVANISQKVSKVSVKPSVSANAQVKVPSKIKASVKVVASENKTEHKRKPTADELRVLKEQKEQRDSFLQIEIRKKLADVRLMERRAELSQMELEKKAGNTLPLDLVRRIQVINFQSILNNFLLETKNMATIMVEKFGGSRSDVVEIEHKLNEIFKRTVETTKKNVDKETEAAVSEYSEVRSRGEKK